MSRAAGSGSGAGRATPLVHWLKPSLASRYWADAVMRQPAPQAADWVASAGRLLQGVFPQPAGGAGGARSGRAGPKEGGGADDRRRQVRESGARRAAGGRRALARRN